MISQAPDFSRRAVLSIFTLGLGVAVFPVGAPARAESQSVVDIVFGEIERRIVEDYYKRQLEGWQAANGSKTVSKKKHKDLPPGLAKKGRLPPGLEKQLVRNGHLPPGLEYRNLPTDLEGQLPRLPTGYQYQIADNRVLLIQRATNLILDVIEVAAADVTD